MKLTFANVKIPFSARQCGLCALAILVALLIILAGAFSLRYLRTAMEDRTGQALASTAATVAGKMDIQFVERAGDLRILSQAEALRTGNQALITRHLTNLLASYPIYFWAGWVDRDDHLLVSTTPLPPGQQLNLQAELSLIHQGAPVIIRAPQQQGHQSERSGVTFLGRVEDEQGQLLGTLVTRMGLSNFEETYQRDIALFEQLWGDGTNIEVQLFEPGGRALVDSRLQEAGRLSLRDLNTKSTIASQLAAEGFVREEHARRHVPVLTGYATTKGLAQGEGKGWTVLLKIDQAAVAPRINAILLKTAGGLLLIIAPLLCGILFSLLYLQRAKSQRLQDLSRAEGAERALHLEQQKMTLTTYLRAILDGATEVSIIATDREGLITTFNAGAERLLGYSAEEMIGKATPVVFHLEAEVAAHAATLSKRYGRPIHGFEAFVEEALHSSAEQREWTYVKKNGERLTVYLTVTVLHDPSGNISGYLGIATNITERKQTESLALEREKHLRAILDHAVDGIITITEQGLIQSFNPAAESIFGYPASEVLGQNVKLLMPSPYQEEHDGYLTAYLRTGQAKIIGTGREVVGRRKDGSTFPLDLGVSEVQGSSRRLFTGIVRDITARKQVETELSEREARIRAIVDHAVDGIVTIDARGTIESFNPAAESIFGYPASEVLGQNVKLLMPSPYQEEHDGYLAAYLQTGQAKIIGTGREVIGRRKDGSTFPMDLGVSEVQGSSRRHFTGIIRDITDRKQAEASVQEQIQLSLLAAEINSILVKSATLPAMLQQCAAAMIRHLDAAFSRIWLINPSDLCGDCHKAASCTNRTECLHLTASAGLSENLNGEYRRVPLGALKIGKIAQGWGAMSTNDVLGEDRLPNKPWLTEQGLQAFAGYPLTVGTQVVGVMALFSRHRFSEQTLKTLERIAQVISLGVERKRVEEDRQSTLTLLTNVMNNTPDFIYVKDRNLRVLLCNNVCAQAIGKTPAEMQGHTDVENGWDPELVHGNPSKGIKGFEVDDREALSGKIVHNLADPANVGDTVRIFDTFKVPLRNSAGEIIGLLGISRDITERKQIEESRQRLASIIESSDDAIISKTLDGLVTSWNLGAERLFGYSASEMMGRPITRLFPPDRLDEEPSLIQQLQQGHPINHFETVRQRKDGQLIEISATLSLIRDAQGEVIGVSKIARDITERKQAQKELATARDQALAATRAKSEFLASMSHEIRTPMNAIIGMAELLSDTPLNEHQTEYVRRLGRASQTLLNLINSILDLSKIEAGFLELESVPFNVVELTERVSEISAIQAHAKLLELICFVSPDVPPNLIGDPTRLQQILINLLGNAVKFTERGEIYLHVEPDPDDQIPGALRFTVTDTGIGIPADKVAHIFESFTQVDASTTRKYGGTGLGLAISKKLVELMGGRITLRSTVGQGSTFSFTARFAVALISQTPTTTLSLTGQRILAVDDNSTNLMLLRETLSRYGATILEASDGVQALARLKALQASNQLPQLIITDGHMPNMDGVQLVHAIQADPALASLPIIMLTSDARIGNSATAKQLKIQALVSKPIARALLLKQVARALGHGAILPAATASSAAPSPWMTQPPTTPAPDQHRALAKLRVLVVDDNADNQFLIQSYLTHQVEALDLADDGQQAVNRVKAGAYDIVLMDMQMPVMDGYTATRAIRDWEQTLGRSPMPILALTAHALQGEVQRTLEAGCTAYLAKPVLREDLLAALQTHTASNEPALRPAPAATTPTINPALQAMIPGYLTRRREDLHICRNLLAHKDFPSISALMHKMAGTGGGYGFPQLTDLGRQLEQAAAQQDSAAIQRHLDRLEHVLAEIGDGTAQP